MGAPELKLGEGETRRAMNRGQTSIFKTKIEKPALPYAHTVGGGMAGKVFRLIVLLLGITFSIGLFIAPKTTMTAVLITFTGLIISQAFLRVLAVLSPKKKFYIPQSRNPFERTHARDWPAYTVLVPLKDEAHMVTELIKTLSKLHYPKNRLQIIFITEEDDPATCQAVTKALIPPFEHVIVPRAGSTAPRTKPHALNIAMKTARGDIVTIYDAEDAPHPQQLKAAVQAFAKNPKWGALQAPLDYYNTQESWLAAQFGLEYAAQFHVWIPLMVRLNMPFPLGGTSNHIRRKALESVRSGDMYWDSYNVTEDADLSFRLSASGWDIGYITPPTQEEAVSTLRPWTNQRTRWMKGFMQSWRVHMDQPLAPGGWRGIRRQITLQFTLGSVLLAGLFHAPICLFLLGWFGFNLLTQGSAPVAPIVTLSLFCGYGSALLISAAGAIRARKPRLLLALPLMPLYWLCLFLPTYKAAYEYINNPYYWAKTTHGLSAVKTPVARDDMTKTVLLPTPYWHRILPLATVQRNKASDEVFTGQRAPTAAE